MCQFINVNKQSSLAWLGCVHFLRDEHDTNYFKYGRHFWEVLNAFIKLLGCQLIDCVRLVEVIKLNDFQSAVQQVHQ